MTTNIKVPYGKKDFLDLKVPEKNLIGVYSAKEGEPIKEEKKAIEKALSNPIGTLPLTELAKNKKDAMIAINDASRPNIQIKVLPILVDYLLKAGMKREDIKVMIGVGSHRPAYEKEIDEMLGELNGKIEIVEHNAFTSEMKNFGKTSLGYVCEVNRLFAESDLKIVLGTVLPHPFAGFSGGGKMVSVGVSSAAAISSTHTPDMLDHPDTSWGWIRNNPFYLNAIEQAEMVGVDFAINAVMDEDGSLFHISAGKVKEAQMSCIEKAKELFEVHIPEKADIVVVSSGYPKDANLYHVGAMAICAIAGSSVKFPPIKENGSIIVASPMEDGVYNQVFYDTLKDGSSPAEVMKKVRAMSDLEPGHHRAYGVAQVLDKYKVIIAQSKLDSETIKSAHMEYDDSLQDAFDATLKEYGDNAKVVVLLSSHRMVVISE